MLSRFAAGRSGKLNGTEQCRQYTLVTYPEALNRPGTVAPPIELALFEAREQMEETMIRWMHRIISSQQQFQLELVQHVDSLTGQLQIAILDKTLFQRLAGQLKVVSQYINSCDCAEMHFNIRPNTRLLKNAIDPDFQGIYAIREFHLLKKTHDFDTYQPVNVFALRP
ncbi:MAG: hypothetical protein I8H66_09665 [Sphingobacteriia bacterium]|nr:hypothetical protein [Sphingobacteriia bacterium]